MIFSSLQFPLSPMHGPALMISLQQLKYQRMQLHIDTCMQNSLETVMEDCMVCLTPKLSYFQYFSIKFDCFHPDDKFCLEYMQLACIENCKFVESVLSTELDILKSAGYVHVNIHTHTHTAHTQHTTHTCIHVHTCTDIHIYTHLQEYIQSK